MCSSRDFHFTPIILSLSALRVVPSSGTGSLNYLQCVENCEKGGNWPLDPKHVFEVDPDTLKLPEHQVSRPKMIPPVLSILF